MSTARRPHVARSAATPQRTAPAPAAAGRPAGRVLNGYLLLAALGIGCYFLLPPAAQNLGFIVSNVVALTAVLGARRAGLLSPGPGWPLIAAFPAATGVGNAIYFVNDTVRHVDPFPSPGDGFFLAAYLLLAAGLLRLHQQRTGARDQAAVLDSAIITLGVAAASWVVFMAPVLHDAAAPLLERLTALGYPVADMLVVAVAARFFLARGRGPAFRLLGTVVLLMLVADSTFAVLNLLGAYSTGHLVDTLILGYNLGWGAVALHPGAAALAAPAPPAAVRPSWRRLGSLTVASLTAPTVLVVQLLTRHTDGIVVTALGGMLLFLLVVLRMAGLVQRLETTLAERQLLQAELEHRALHDELTGLANRRCFVTAARAALDAAPRGGVTVLFIDLDRFKAVNDTLGHAAGDRLLMATADRLRQATGTGDVVARLGGDEFAVLLHGADPRARERTAAALAHPVRAHGLELSISASIGVATSQPGDEVDDLLHAADTGMYTAKQDNHRRHHSHPAPSAPAAPAVPAQAAPRPGTPASGLPPRGARLVS